MTGAVLDEAANVLRTLADMDRKALVRKWEVVFGTLAPRNAQVELLRGALAWHDQMRYESETEVAQLIRRLQRKAVSAPAAVLASGTRLLREWQGRTYHVTVVADGFEYAGRTWRSLSAISREITGTAWSGPVFFGLKR